MIKLVSSSILRFLAGNLLGVVVKFFKKHILLVALTVQKVKPVHVLDKIEQILAQIKTGEFTKAEIQHLTDNIRLSIKEDPSKGKELGELFFVQKYAKIYITEQK